MIDWDPDVDGPGVVRSVDPLVRAIERQSEADKALLTLALVALARQRAAERLDSESAP